ncbi:MAG TPA: hypothetical protein PK431_04080 [Chitinophagales bacterium]|nr:hypothetical protein [Chitinophagales bacterium]
MQKTILLFAIICSVMYANAQGCSDAGFCTLGSLKSNFDFEKKDSTSIKEKEIKNTIGIGFSYGLGEDKNNNFNPFLIYNRKLTKHVELQTKLTSAFINGKRGNVNYLSDIYIATNYSLKLKNKKPKLNQHLNIIAGLKIPFSTANFKKNGQALPMAYQPSLATFDFIAGVNYIVYGFELNAAFQIPFASINKNKYFNDDDTYTFGKDSLRFANTNLFKRKPDFLLRFGYVFHTKNYKWLFKPNVLNIIHLGKDTYVDTLGKRQKIEGSEGYTLNTAFNMTYIINKHHNFELSAGTPLVVRKVRPDGLTRKVAVALEYHFNF